MDAPPIIPRPVHVQCLPGRCVLPPHTVIAYHGEHAAGIARYLATFLEELDLHVDVQPAGDSAAITSGAMPSGARILLVHALRFGWEKRPVLCSVQLCSRRPRCESVMPCPCSSHPAPCAGSDTVYGAVQHSVSLAKAQSPACHRYIYLAALRSTMCLLSQGN